MKGIVKKITAFLLSAVLVSTSTGCAASSNPAASDSENTAVSSSQAETVSAPDSVADSASESTAASIESNTEPSDAVSDGSDSLVDEEASSDTNWQEKVEEKRKQKRLRKAILATAYRVLYATSASGGTADQSEKRYVPSAGDEYDYWMTLELYCNLLQVNYDETVTMVSGSVLSIDEESAKQALYVLFPDFDGVLLKEKPEGYENNLYNCSYDNGKYYVGVGDFSDVIRLSAYRENEDGSVDVIAMLDDSEDPKSFEVHLITNPYVVQNADAISNKTIEYVTVNTSDSTSLSDEWRDAREPSEKLEEELGATLPVMEGITSSWYNGVDFEDADSFWKAMYFVLSSGDFPYSTEKTRTGVDYDNPRYGTLMFYGNDEVSQIGKVMLDGSSELPDFSENVNGLTKEETGYLIDTGVIGEGWAIVPDYDSEEYHDDGTISITLFRAEGEYDDADEVELSADYVNGGVHFVLRPEETDINMNTGKYVIQSMEIVKMDRD